MIVYVVYSIKPPYLPVYVADTQKECAIFLGVSQRCLQKYLDKKSHVYCSHFFVRKVFILTDE